MYVKQDPCVLSGNCFLDITYVCGVGTESLLDADQAGNGLIYSFRQFIGRCRH